MADQTLVEFLRTLVSIPSVNPLLADDPRVGTEKPLAHFLADHLKGKGFAVEWHEITNGRPNVVGRFGPAAPRRSLLIESHLDTQGIHGMTVPPFDGIVRDGRLYGRGACDTKGPMAAALMALDEKILARLAAAGCQVICVGAVGEEKGNIGAEQLVDLDVGADEALVLEPTELAVVHAHKGALWFEIEVEGVAAHGSNPALGLSAIGGMMQVMQLVQRQVDEERRERSNALLGQSTVNIGIIKGGTSINIVPERCVIEVDRRTLPGDDNRQILQRLRDGLRQLQEQGAIKGSSVRLIKEGLPFETTADSRLVRRLGASCEDCGVAPRAEGAAWYSDAGPFSRTCREIAVFGPGSIAQAHTADEYIELESLEKGRAVIARFLARLAEELERGGDIA